MADPLILAADLGGTHISFRLSDASNNIILEQDYRSAQFSDFAQAIATFLAEDAAKNCPITSACFAVAGPVTANKAHITNLPWQIDTDQLAQRFALGTVQLCNDFVAVAQGINALAASDIITLQAGQYQANAPQVVIGAGTGLGQAVILPTAQGQQIIATEGGHSDFAPSDEQQMRLLSYLRKKHHYISYEHIISGPGLVHIYHFLLNDQQLTADPPLALAMQQHDPAAAISEFALKQTDPIAQQALDLFIKIYGAQAANLALTLLATGGVYIAGAIAAKNKARFINGPFLSGFLAKGKMAKLMPTIPVHLINQPKVGLLGAELLARQN